MCVDKARNDKFTMLEANYLRLQAAFLGHDLLNHRVNNVFYYPCYLARWWNGQ